MVDGSLLLLLFTVKKGGPKVVCAFEYVCFITAEPIYQAEIIFIKYCRKHVGYT